MGERAVLYGGPRCPLAPATLTRGSSLGTPTLAPDLALPSTSPSTTMTLLRLRAQRMHLFVVPALPNCITTQKARTVALLQPSRAAVRAPHLCTALMSAHCTDIAVANCAQVPRGTSSVRHSLFSYYCITTYSYFGTTLMKAGFSTSTSVSLRLAAAALSISS